MRKLILLLAILISVPLVSAQFQITHPSLNFTNYQTALAQPSGTTEIYSVNVSNNGDVRLDKVFLSLSFLPSSWYEIGESKPLNVGETGEFTYTIKLPKDASGSIDLDLTAHGIKGFGEVTRTTVKVKLSDENSQPTETETTTQIIPTTTVYPEKDFLSRYANYIAVILIVLILISLAILFKS